MYEFTCDRCGRVIRSAGDKPKRCPGCGQATPVLSDGPVFNDTEGQSISIGSLQFEEGPVIKNADKRSGPVTEDKPASGLRPRERKIPWFIDIFLYPCNKAGLIMLAVFIGVPFTLKVIGQFMRVAMLSLPALLPFFLFFGIIAWLIDFVLLLYFFWYFAECIRSSAEGRLRVPDTVATTPGLAEILLQAFKIFLCLFIFCFPAAFYYYKARQVDGIFISLASCGVLLLPMALLSVVIFDSLTGLNPVVILGSIFNALFRYLGTVTLLFLFIAFSVWVLKSVVKHIPMSWLILLLTIYFMIVGAHVLGSFYYRCERKLNWDV
jgi:hypothetical protein